MTRRERVKALWDMLTDSHAEIAIKVVGFNTNSLAAREAFDESKGTSARSRLRCADQSLTDAVDLLRAQALRILRTADELETI